MEARSNPPNLLSSLSEISRAFEKAGFNDLAKFDLSCMALTNSPDVLQFVIYRGAVAYKTLKNVVHQYKASRRTFFRQVITFESSSSEVFGSNKVLNRPDARGVEIESKVDALANKGAIPSHLIL